MTARMIVWGLLLVGAAALAHADEPADPAAEAAHARKAGWPEDMGRNQDGKLSRSESKGLMRRFFGRNDANKDGVLDDEELGALTRRMRERGGSNPRSIDSRCQQTLAPSPAAIALLARFRQRRA